MMKHNYIIKFTVLPAEWLPVIKTTDVVKTVFDNTGLPLFLNGEHAQKIDF